MVAPASRANSFWVIFAAGVWATAVLLMVSDVLGDHGHEQETNAALRGIARTLSGEVIGDALETPMQMTSSLTLTVCENKGCQQACVVSSDGAVTCTCLDGYTLAEDGTTCSGK